MRSYFLTELNADLIKGDKVWKLTKPLSYFSASLEQFITIPVGFETDLSSVPRVPIAYWIWGGRAHREGVLHDYLFRVDSTPCVSFQLANKLFMEAMDARGKNPFIKYPMFWCVCAFGLGSYHKRKVMDEL